MCKKILQLFGNFLKVIRIAFLEFFSKKHQTVVNETHIVNDWVSIQWIEMFSELVPGNLVNTETTGGPSVNICPVWLL